MVFMPQGSMLSSVQCFLYSCCACTWFVPISEQGSASETIVCCRAGGSGCDGEVFTLPGAAQCIEGTGQAASGSITAPPLSEFTTWTALGSCESPPDTSPWGVPPMAWREQLLLPVCSREAETRREAEFGGAQHIPEQNSVLYHMTRFTSVWAWVWD